MAPSLNTATLGARTVVAFPVAAAAAAFTVRPTSAGDMSAAAASVPSSAASTATLTAGALRPMRSRSFFRLYVRCSGSNASTLDTRWDFPRGAAGTPGLVDRHSDRSASDGIL